MADPSNPRADVPSGTGNSDNPSSAANSAGGTTGGPLLMPGGEEFDATLVEALFMNELLALNDLVSSSDGEGGGGGEGDVASGFEGLAGLLGSSVPGTPPVPPPGPMLGGSDVASAGQQLTVSPLRPNAPHRTETTESLPPARAGAAAADAASTIASSAGDDGPETQQQQNMVHQFATLAGKLGVRLPPNVLSALSQAAEASASASASANDSTSGSASADSIAAESSIARQDEESIAAKSIAAIEEGSRKRRASSPPGGGAGSAALPVPSSLPSSLPSPTNLDTASSSADASSEAASKKKKPRLQDTATRYAALKAENETLKRHLANVTHTTTLVDKERAEAERKLAGMVTKETADERQVGPVLEKFGEMYSDYGRRRQEELTFHLEQLERLAAPTTITKMTLWTCGQSDQFFFKPRSHPIAGILMKELDITPVQGRKIVERRDKIRAVCDNIRQCLVLMSRLKSLCQHKQKVFHDRMTKCQEILNPLQVARLLVWVDSHADTLESVCPGWGSERMSKRSAAAATTPKLPTMAGEAAKDGAAT